MPALYLISSFFAVFAFLSLLPGCKRTVEEKSEVENAEGSAHKGFLENAVCLSDGGIGFTHKKESGKDHFIWSWGTEYAIDSLTAAAARLWIDTNGKLSNGEDAAPIVVNDMSYKNGHHQKGHATHQQGLSIDIAYFHKDGVKVDQYHNSFLDFSKGKQSSEVDYERIGLFLKYLDEYARRRCSGIRQIFITSKLYPGFSKEVANHKLDLEINLSASAIHKNHFHVDLIRANSDYLHRLNSGECTVLKNEPPMVQEFASPITDVTIPYNKITDFRDISNEIRSENETPDPSQLP